MQTRKWLSFIERMNAKYFFAFLFIYMILLTFQGVDLSDEGFVGTFYQQIFRNPESVQYNFMFWFSGIVGGVFNLFFESTGLLGLRLLSAVLTISCVILTYQLLKPHLNHGSLKLGLLIIILFLSNNTKVFHYNYLSVLLYILTISFLFRGLKNHRWYWFVVSGFLVALDTLTRIPSIVNLGLVIFILFYGYKNHTALNMQIRQSLQFIIGFVVGVLGLLLIMKIIGHYEIFLGALKLVVNMGSNNQEGHYGLTKLLGQFFATYSVSIKYSFILLLLLFLLILGVHTYRISSYYKKGVVEVLKYALVTFVSYLIVTGLIDHKVMLYLLTGVTLIAGFLILSVKGYTDIQTLMLMGCYILLAYPFGSSAGLTTVGIYCLWISFPIALDYFLKIKKTNISVSIIESKSSFTTALESNQTRWNKFLKYSIMLGICACLYHAWYYPFFDYHDRLKMHHGLENEHMQGIFTTKERAEVINDLIVESKKYVRKGDLVLAYHSFPIFHYMTETIPYVRNSMPWFYNTVIFEEELQNAYQRTGLLPVVIRQKRKTFGKSDSGWPDAPIYYDSIWYQKNRGRDSCMNNFLREYKYRNVWENQIFEILTPH